MKRFKLFTGAVLVLIVLGLSSCLDEELDSQTAFGIRHDIDLEEYNAIGANDYPYNTSDYPDFSPVISFSYSLDGSQSEDYSASGVLVKADWILTAGHNFYVADEQSSPAPKEGIVVLFGDDPNNPISVHAVEKLVFHPTWITDNADFLNANDLCLVKLATPITSVTPAQINYSNSEELESTIWYCGFGDYSQESGQDPDLWSVRHAIENVLDRKVSGITTSLQGHTYSGGLLAFDFDSPMGDVNSLGDDEVNSDEELLGYGDSDATATNFEGTTVQGDSGGPLFVRFGNTWKVAGILSGGVSEPFWDHQDGDYGDISVFIRVSTHEAWIKSVIN